MLNVARARAEVDLGALERNYRAIRQRVADGVRVLCVVKADAYGHGAQAVAKKYEELGADYFGVATVDEGMDLRDGGVTTPVLVMSGIMPWDDVDSFVEQGLVPAVSSFAMLERLSGVCRKGRATVHVKVDTGMGRLGFSHEEVPELIERLKISPAIDVEGLMTHFPSSERIDAYGREQVTRFRSVVDLFRQNGIEPKLVHMANSGAVVNYPEAHFDMIRPGIMMYGSYPDPRLRERLVLEPVMALRSHVAVVRQFATGTGLSYGGTFVTERTTRVAYVPVGYADGYPRALSNKGAVLVRGKRCRLLGRVCMDWILADVTDLPDVAPGEDVTLLGGRDDDVITANEMAEMVGTIPYEILCGVSRRIARVYVH
jgi:alanine racemase